MTRVCWTAARAGAACSVSLTARSFHSSTTLLVTAGFRGRFRCVLPPVAHATLNNGHTDIEKSAMTVVSVKTSPLFILLTLMFSSFCRGSYEVRRDGRRKDVTRGQKIFSCDILWAL